jgi:hypothetical protein
VRGVLPRNGRRGGCGNGPGQAESRAVALGLLGAVRDVEGVVAVRDRLTYRPGS